MSEQSSNCADIRAAGDEQACRRVAQTVDIQVRRQIVCSQISVYFSSVIERLNREIRRRTRVVGTFPDGNSALMLVCARLRHVAGTQWGCKKYMNMKHLEAALDDTSIAG